MLVVIFKYKDKYYSVDITTYLMEKITMMNGRIKWNVLK